MNWKAFAIALIVCLGIGLSLDAPTITNPADGAIISANIFNITWDSVIGAGCYKIIQDGATPGFTTSNPYYEVSGVAENQHSYSVQSTSAANGCPTYTWDGGTSSVTVYIDRTAPSVTTIQQTTATKGTSTSFSVTATDSGTYPNAGVKSCDFYWNGAKVAAMAQSGTTWSYSYTPTTAGTFSAYANCTDAASLSANTPTQITVSQPAETVPPTVSITSPPNGVTINETVSITATASDNVGVAKVEFYIGGTLKSTAISSPYTYSWDTTSSGNGQYSVIARAYDAAGNNAAATAIVTVNNYIYVPPEPGTGSMSVQIIEPAQFAEYVEGDDVHIKVLVEDQNGAAEGATVAVSGVCSKTLTDLGSGIYDIMCPAALGETDVIVSATKGTLTATNTTKINVKCKPSAAITSEGTNVLIALSCGGSAYDGPFVVTADGKEVEITNASTEGTYALQLSEGMHNISVQMTAYEKPYPYNQEVTLTPTTGGAMEEIKQTLMNNWYFVIAALAAIVLIGYAYSKHGEKERKKENIQEKIIEAVEKYAAAVAEPEKRRDRERHLRVRKAKGWVTDEEYDGEMKKMNSLCENAAAEKTVLEQNNREWLLYPESQQLISKNVKAIVDDAKKENMDELEKLIRQSIRRGEYGTQKEEAFEELLGWTKWGFTEQDLKKMTNEELR